MFLTSFLYSSPLCLERIVIQRAGTACRMIGRSDLVVLVAKDIMVTLFLLLQSDGRWALYLFDRVEFAFGIPIPNLS